MEAVLEYLKGEKVTTATVFWKENSKTKPDYYAEIAKENEWIVFPFEVAEFNREKIHG
jgi:hypoxanthine phosphoribosyltransferase